LPSGYRPWGQLDWILPRAGVDHWSILGVLGTEERCTASFSSAKDLCTIESTLHLNILDPSTEPQANFAARYDELRERLIRSGCDDGKFPEVPLMADIDTILEHVVAFLKDSTANVILDITSMPKWWFFPTLRFLLSDDRVENLIVTYTSALAYDDQLSSDPAPLAPLPTFDDPPLRVSHDELIVSVGFAPLGLRDLYAGQFGRVRYLFPFPPGPPFFSRNWDFLRALETEVESRKLVSERPWAIHGYDCPSVFEALRTFTNNGLRTAAFAPFGPKPMSLAMCLFALAAGAAGKAPVHVFYTQPRRYAIDYSTGIRMRGIRPDIRAYCVRIAGRDLYTI
jgi:hypothetical protein